MSITCCPSCSGGSCQQVIGWPTASCPPVGYPTDKTRCLPCPRRTPKALDDVADIVLAYKPKPKAEAAKKRQRKARKIERDKAK